MEPTTGVTVYDEGSVAIALAGTKCNFYWPQTSLLPEDVASQVQSSILELRTALAKLKDVDFTPLRQKFDQTNIGMYCIGRKATMEVCRVVRLS